MTAQSAFARTESEMMLHPIARENFDTAVIAMNGHRDGDGTFWILQPNALQL